VRYVEQTLSEDEQAALAAHIHGCEACDMALLMLASGERPSERKSEEGASLDTFLHRTQLLSQFAPGAIVGRFKVLHPVGRGAMGTVYAAHDPQLDRNVALKVLLDEVVDVASGSLGSDGASDGRLVREARSMAKLAHPNIVTVFEVGIADGRVFLAMQLVDGVTLADWLLSTPPRERVLRLFVDAARAVDAAHRAGIVHRDLKPHNILVSRDGEPKVTDFGLADTSAVGRGGPHDENGPISTSTLHRTRGLVGTPAYMAPEVLLGGHATPASDQFSLAICLHEALSGRRPYQASTLDELIDKVESHAPWVDPSLPGGLSRALRRALAREPAARFGSMGELATALAEAAAQAGATSTPRFGAARAVPLTLAVLLLAGAGGAWALRGRLAADRPAPIAPVAEAAPAALAPAGQASGAPLAATTPPTAATVTTPSAPEPNAHATRAPGRPTATARAAITPSSPPRQGATAATAATAAAPSTPGAASAATATDDWLRRRR